MIYFDSTVGSFSTNPYDPYTYSNHITTGNYANIYFGTGTSTTSETSSQLKSITSIIVNNNIYPYSGYQTAQITTGNYYDDWFDRCHTYPIFSIPSIEQQPSLQNSLPSIPPLRPPKPNSEEIEAQTKAQKLLLEYLDKDNKQRYLEKKPIEIVSGLFNDIIYQIPIHKLEKIRALKNGDIISRLCLIVKEPEYIPLEDVILTKLLHILHDEESALRTANHFDTKENLLTRLN